MGGVAARNRQSGPTAFTWANRPSAAAVPARTRIWISDFGAGGGSEWYSDGTNWRPVGNMVVLPGTVTPVTFTAQSPSLKLSVCKSFAIPAGMIIPGARAELSAKFNTAANTDNKYFRLYLNAATPGPYLANYNASGGTVVAVQLAGKIDFLTNSTQLGTLAGNGDFAVSASDFYAGTVTTTSAFTIDVVASITSTSDAVTMKSCHGALFFR